MKFGYCTQNLFFNNSFLNNIINAYDDGIDNYWNNSVIGNIWDDYNGEDSNNDGIGDTPYSISGSANNQDNYPIWWDFIDISINTPNPNDFFGTIAPSFTISIDKGIPRTTWYTIDTGLTNITFTGSTGTVDQTEWDKISTGFVTLSFYANNTLGVISSSQVVISKDVDNPIIIINSPKPNDLIGEISPSFNVEVIDANIDIMWYTIDGGITNITFTENGTISQSAWDALLEGNVIIRFYTNDSVGNVNFQEITVIKDVTAPMITINNPQNNDVIGATAPNFNIYIDEPNLDGVWYSLNGGTNITFTVLTGTINQALWDALPEGNVVIRFYANDSVGNVNFQEVTVVKEITQPSPPRIPGFYLLILVGTISVMVVIIIKKRVNHLTPP